MIMGAGHITPAAELFWAVLLMTAPYLALLGIGLIWGALRHGLRYRIKPVNRKTEL